MDQFKAGGFVVDDSLVWSGLAGGFVLSGEIACKGKILISVAKVLKRLDPGVADPRVQTVRYKYNASVQGFNNLYRIDNAHSHPGHVDAHHKHDFDWQTGDELAGSPIWVGAHGWQTLGSFIELVELWYWENCDTLPEPDAVAQLGTASSSGLLFR